MGSSGIDTKLTRHMINEAIADMLNWYPEDRLTIHMSSAAYAEVNKAGLLVDGKYNGLVVEIFDELEPNMVYVAGKE